MIVVRMMGGLGNQMFQYAFGLALADFYKTKLVLDILHLKNPIKFEKVSRDFHIDKIVSHFELLTERQYHSIFLSHPSKFIRYIDKINRKFFPISFYKEKQIFFDEGVFKLNPPAYFTGYWQSPLYFESISSQIKKTFNFDFPISPKLKEIESDIVESNSVCIHYRRTDMVQNPSDLSNKKEYYDKALQDLIKNNSNLKAYIFSDDPEWCRKEIKIPIPHEIVSDEKDIESPLRDLQLMVKCQHFIIPNSTFSWWAAWLGQNSKSQVYVPKVWHTDPKLSLTDICPPHWIRISNENIDSPKVIF